MNEDINFLFDISSGRHSRQDSGGSGDSGVYSTEGGSSLQQPDSSQSFTKLVPFDLDQVKMQDMTAGLDSQYLITDMGMVDICV